MQGCSERVDPRNSAVFSLPNGQETGKPAENSWKIQEKGGRGVFFSRAGDPSTKITVPRFLRGILKLLTGVTPTLPPHPPSCDCPPCIHEMEHLP